MFRGLIGFAMGMGAGWKISKLHVLGQIDGVETALYMLLAVIVSMGVVLWIEPKAETGEWK